MAMFNPADQRRRLDSDTGYRWALSLGFEETRSVGGLASSADADLNMAIRCVLVGYDEAAQELMNRAHHWLSVAIQENERPRAYAIGGTEAQRHLNLALCNWLLYGRQDEENFRLHVQFYEQFLERTRNCRNKSEISLALPHYLDAGVCDLVLARFSEAGLTPPASPAAPRTDAEMCYILCASDSDAASEELPVLAKNFLNRNTNTWLSNGNFLHAAEWMKIVHWNGSGSKSPPKLAVLKCYDYLTGVAAPA